MRANARLKCQIASVSLKYLGKARRQHMINCMLLGRGKREMMKFVKFPLLSGASKANLETRKSRRVMEVS
jgi:hypothetical protein